MNFRVAGGVVLALCLTLGVGAAAETRTVEEVGAVSYVAGNSSRQTARNRARDRALGNAVIRVASELLLEEGIVSPPGSSLSQALGGQSVEYASRYRIVEDRGPGPAVLTAGGPDATEYVVVVRVEVDEERVRSRLRAAGFTEPSRRAQGGRSVRLQALGVDSYGAYQALLGAVRAQSGVAGVVPNSFSESRIELRVDTRDVGHVLVSRLAAEPIPGLQIVPIRTGDDELSVRVFWTPPAPEGVLGAGSP